MKIHALTVMLLVLPVAAALAQEGVAQEDVEQELKALRGRFQSRYPTLLALKADGKLGEIFDGLAGAVKEAYILEKARPDDPESPSIGAFLAAENKDRARLFVLLAKKTEISEEVFAKRTAERNFERADPDDFLKPEGRDWIRKRDWKAEEDK